MSKAIYWYIIGKRIIIPIYDWITQINNDVYVSACIDIAAFYVMKALHHVCILSPLLLIQNQWKPGWTGKQLITFAFAQLYFFECYWICCMNYSLPLASFKLTLPANVKLVHTSTYYKKEFGVRKLTIIKMIWRTSFQCIFYR